MKTEGDIAAIRYNLGDRIKELRDGQSLSQYQFARMIQMDRTYLISVEKGKRNVSIDNLCKIALGLGINLSELFRDVDERESVARRLELMKELLRQEEEAKAAKEAAKAAAEEEAEDADAPTEATEAPAEQDAEQAAQDAEA